MDERSQNKRIIRWVILVVFIWIAMIVFSIFSVNAQTIKTINLPEGYVRVPVDKDSFGEYLRNIKLRKDDTVRYYNGKVLSWQGHYAVLDIDIGREDLQQCADIVMRLRAEYLYSQKRYSEIKFKYLRDGKYRYYNPKIKLSSYMRGVYMYANTTSLNKQMKKISPNIVQIGDAFITPGGHAMIIVDLAVNMYDEKIMLMAQGYMPAQDIHIVRNLRKEHWIPLTDTINAGWVFFKEELKTW